MIIRGENRKLLSLLLTISISFLSACAASGPKFVQVREPEGNSCLLYLYRINHPPFARAATVYINNEKIGDLRDNGFFALHHPQGELVVKTKWAIDTFVPSKEITIDCNRLETHYVRLGGSMTVFVGTSGSSAVTRSGMLEVDKETALNELKDLHDSLPEKYGAK